MSGALLLFGYGLVRSPANVLFQAAYGTRQIPVAMALTPPCALLALFIYGRVLSSLGPKKTLAASLGAFGAIVLALYGALQIGWRPAPMILYIFKEIYAILAIEQYWSFLNSTLTEESAKKLNSLVNGLFSVGAIAGDATVGLLARSIGSVNLLLIAAASFLPAAYFAWRAYEKCGEPGPRPKDEPQQGHLGLRSLISSPLLVCLFGVVFMSQMVSASTELNFQYRLESAIPDLDYRTAYSGWFFAALNVATLSLDFIGVPIAIQFISLKAIHLAIPIIHLAASAAALLLPTLGTAGTAFFLFKCLDYSFFRSTKEILYIPLSYDARYRSKEIIDVVGYRFGKGGTSLFILAARKAGLWADRAYSGLALLGAVLWLTLAAPLLRRYEKAKKSL